MEKIGKKEINPREAVGQGIADRKGFKECNCKSGCGSKKRACKAAEMLCILSVTVMKIIVLIFNYKY